MSANALHYHKDEHEWFDDDKEYFLTLGDRVSYLLQLTFHEKETLLGDE